MLYWNSIEVDNLKLSNREVDGETDPQRQTVIDVILSMLLE